MTTYAPSSIIMTSAHSPGCSGSNTASTDVDFSGDSTSVVAFVSTEEDSLGLLMPFTGSLSTDLISATATDGDDVTPTSTLDAASVPISSTLLTISTVASTNMLGPLRTSPTSLSTEPVTFPSVTPNVPTLREVPQVNVRVLNATSVLLTWTRVEAAIGYRLVITPQLQTNRQRASAQQTIEVDCCNYM